MNFSLPKNIINPFSKAPWTSTVLESEKLFSIDRLEQLAQSLATVQKVTHTPYKMYSLHTRLKNNASALLKTYRTTASELESAQDIDPALEWLLDNYHLVEDQISEIKKDLPINFYRQLPKLKEGSFAGHARVFSLAWTFFSHTDNHFDPENFRRFINAYQEIQPLTIGELWATAIILRFVLVDNLRRITDQVSDERCICVDVDKFADRLFAPKSDQSEIKRGISTYDGKPMPEVFAAHLAIRLHNHCPITVSELEWLKQKIQLQEWLEKKLRLQGLSVEEAINKVQQRQGAANVTVRNIITSMQLISDIDWVDMFESVSIVDARLRSESEFDAMDALTRNLYRNEIEELARRSPYTELEITSQVLKTASIAAKSVTDTVEVERLGDPGYHLISAGRRAFEAAMKFKPSLRLKFTRLQIGLGINGYVGLIVLLTAGLLLFAASVFTLSGLTSGWIILLALVGFVPATEIATALVNTYITAYFGAKLLPSLELKSGVPLSLRTLVVIPTLLTSEVDILEQVKQLEVHFLSDSHGDLTFALLSDGIDADQAVLENDMPLLTVATQALKQLNYRYGPGPAGNRFLLLHRRRVFNASENKWMGWERKRGKLHELNRLLRGATDTTFIAVNDQPSQVPDNVRFVITLDADTRLPRGTVRRLIGKMAHPLNRPKFKLNKQRVVDGYGILQPRVVSSLPIGEEDSLYQRLYSSHGGIDPYAAAISDVYQDLFDEGTYTGKGIYDVDAFEASLKGRVPENTVLSHDLFEGVFARAGLVSDLELVEEFPSRYDLAAKRQHRWTRGDWQLLPWIFGKFSGKQAASSLGRFKMLDNLRRSVIAPLTFLMLSLCWLLPMPAALFGTLFALAVIVVPAFVPCFFSTPPLRPDLDIRNHFRDLFGDLKLATTQVFFSVVLLADQAWRMLDAIGTTLIRLLFTRRDLLEWATASRLKKHPPLKFAVFYKQMAAGTLIGLFACVVAFIFNPQVWPLVLPFSLLWLFAPALALLASRPSHTTEMAISDASASDLRLIARQTWRFFETFVTPLDNMLPPDNFQITPEPVIAHRTSPTNISLYLLSTVAAHDFGWSGTLQTIDRLEATFDSMHKLAKYKGHFFNWYGTLELEPLMPEYISSVDSGNLAGHLIVVANACQEWRDTPIASETRHGIKDALQLAHQAITEEPAASGETGQALIVILEQVEDQLNSLDADEELYPILMRLMAKATQATEKILSQTSNGQSEDLVYWIESIGKTLFERERDRLEFIKTPNVQKDRLNLLAQKARSMALAMDFSFLLDPKRKLLSIGYSLANNCLDPSCYDLLASEARLASFFAIAKGDVETKHWFHLGRRFARLKKGSALISWSGSMFEYLMPSLIMREHTNSLLGQTNRLVVKKQQSYGRLLGVPWGISESAYHARDLEFTYQYSTFGIPGLGLKRGLAEDRVIAPYATGLATMIDLPGALLNFVQLSSMGASGRYGFFDAIDFTRSRLSDDKPLAIVHNFMAHHQGMTIVAIANALYANKMVARFHNEPMIQACELLLQERMPRNPSSAHPRAEKVKASSNSSIVEVPTVRRLNALNSGPPLTHLLSNGRYVVMLTAAGSGYSRWNDIAITRWQEDTTRDHFGSFILFRDISSGKTWSAGAQPIGKNADYENSIFDEGHAEFTHHQGTLTATMEVLVSREHDGEVRQISINNCGVSSREIEITSYAEVVLTTPATDNAHPAFSKLFVQTEFIEEYGALIATRRPQSPTEPTAWAAHFSVADGNFNNDPEYESDRAQFIGRGNTISCAAAITNNTPLSKTTGTVVDPIFSLRRRVKIQPGNIVRVAFWTVVAASRDAMLELVDMHNDLNAFARCKTHAWTQAQVQLANLGINSAEAADFQRLAAPIIYADPDFRALGETIIRGASSQSELWAYGISGDLPIVLLQIYDIEDIEQVAQLLQANEFWHLKRLAIDLVIINRYASTYRQDIQVAIETAVRSSQSNLNFFNQHTQASIHIFNSDFLSSESLEKMKSAARVVLDSRNGLIKQQLTRLSQTSTRDFNDHKHKSLTNTTVQQATGSRVNRLGANRKVKYYAKRDGELHPQ